MLARSRHFLDYIVCIKEQKERGVSNIEDLSPTRGNAGVSLAALSQIKITHEGCSLTTFVIGGQSSGSKKHVGVNHVYLLSVRQLHITFDLRL